MVTLLKGQEFFYVVQYNCAGKMEVKKLVCEACGKKIIRASEVVSGEMIKIAIQQRLVNIDTSEVIQSFMFEHIFSIDCDIDLEARKLSKAYILKEKRRYPEKDFKTEIIYS